MASLFGVYSQYYDLLYRDKDYDAEADYVRSLVNRFSDRTVDVLELGCGTGKHAELFASAGWNLLGVERSQEMLSAAKTRIHAMASRNLPGSFDAREGDVRTFRTSRQFDAVLALFHVVSYQTSNDDVTQMFQTAFQHLKPGGLFVYDIWYGPAVLSERPAVRIKRMEDPSISVIRIAEPELCPNTNRVDVNFTVLVTSKTTGTVQQIQERHSMRYFFEPEMDLICRANGFQRLHSEEWMTGHEPTESTWGVCYVTQKI